MISESAFLFHNGSRVKRRVSGGEKGLQPPGSSEKGNNGPEKMTYTPLPTSEIMPIFSCPTDESHTFQPVGS